MVGSLWGEKQQQQKNKRKESIMYVLYIGSFECYMYFFCMHAIICLATMIMNDAHTHTHHTYRYRCIEYQVHTTSIPLIGLYISLYVYSSMCSLSVRA